MSDMRLMSELTTAEQSRLGPKMVPWFEF